MTHAIAELRRRAVSTGRLREPISVTVNPDHTLAVVQVPLAGNGSDAISEQALATLRNRVIPITIGAVPGVTVAATGLTASNHDYNHVLVRRAPLVVGFVLALAFGLLLVSFPSLAISLTAIGLNLLSVGAAYGLLKLVFQGEWLMVEVRDDGVGGAEPAGGGGLAGLVDRVASVDGHLAVASPKGGPTVVRAELPCGS